MKVLTIFVKWRIAMNRKFFKIFAVLLAMAMVLVTFSSCGSEKSKSDSDVVYTYREVWSSGPLNWNPHTWELDIDDSLASYLSTEFVGPGMDDKHPGSWKWEYEAAESITDITESFQDKAKYNIPEDAKEGRVFKIVLDPDMKWENGEQIKAEDYVYSMQMLLSSEMKNYRSSFYTTAELALYNGKEYFSNDKAGKPIYAAWNPGDPEDKPFVFSLKTDIFFFGEPAEKAYKGAKDNFIVNGVDIFEKYKGQDVFEITDSAKADLVAVGNAFGDKNPECWKEFRVYDTGEKYKETPWETVGFYASGEYELILVTAKYISNFDALILLGSTFLVHKPTYEANFRTVEGLKATSYGTDLKTTISYGPYKLASYEKNKQIRLVRNPFWGGYKNPANKGKYVADAIIIDIIEDHATQLQRFGQGLVDTVSLNSDDVEKYKKSERILFTEASYTDRLIFATSDLALKSRDKEKGSGKRIVMRYKDFRKALSLSIDREKYCREATSGYKPAIFLFNSLYHYDIGNDPNSSYRNSYYAKKAILDLYGVDSSPKNADANYARLTGRDLGLAKELFVKAYTQATADGVYKDGEEVPIEIMVSPSDLQPQHIKQQDLLQEFFDEGSKGTPFEGKIKVTFESGDTNRYANVAAGKNMAIKGSWGGGYFYPFRLIGIYVSPSHMGGLQNIHESNGWDPSKVQLPLTIDKADGTKYKDTRTLSEWFDAINGDGDFVSAPASEKLQILAALENATLSSYQCIPLGTMTTAELVSYKIDYGTYDYNIMYVYGGLKNFKFNYTDAEWEAYLKENKGTLNYE